ncbi:MAG: HEAT repeat domain-containing protein [Longimicrobiales bacterium]
MRPRSWLVLLGMVAAPAAAAGQDLAQRVAEVEEGVVRLTYPARPGVEICDQGIRMGEHEFFWHSRGWREDPRNCRSGPVEIEMRVRDRTVRGIEVIRKPSDRTEGTLDLGSVSGEVAARFLLEVARTGGGAGRGEEDAVFPAVLADAQEVWRDLLELARDQAVDEEARTSALFWVGQEAANAVTEGLAELALDEDEDQEVREAAVFALSQRPQDEAVPILMEIARTALQGDTRRAAMFWLAQSEDERVYAFFEEILVGGGGH